MTPQTPSQRLILGAAITLLVVVISFAWVNRVIPNWGSTPQEAARSLPADEMVPDPDLIWNHAITINAPAEAVYPWLVQIGDSRGGFYSYTFIENAFCATSGECRYVNADRVHPEWQSPEKGAQGIIMDYMMIRDYQPGQWVLATPSEKMPFQWTWLWYVEPLDAATSRLIVRHRFEYPPDVPHEVIEAIFTTGYVMERGMMLGIQARAEGRVPSPVEESLGALIWLLVFAMGVACAIHYVRIGAGYHTLGVGLEAVIVLFVLTYIQPPMFLRVLLLLMVASGVVISFNRRQSRQIFARLKNQLAPSSLRSNERDHFTS